MSELAEKIRQLADLVSDIQQLVEDEKPRRYVNWLLMPVDTLIEGEDGAIYHFAGTEGNHVYVFANGRDCATAADPSAMMRIKHPKLAKNQPWKPWFGGDCPVDPRVNVDYILRNAGKLPPLKGVKAGTLDWQWSKAQPQDGDIIAYRIADEQEVR